MGKYRKYAFAENRPKTQVLVGFGCSRGRFRTRRVDLRQIPMVDGQIRAVLAISWLPFFVVFVVKCDLLKIVLKLS